MTPADVCWREEAEQSARPKWWPPLTLPFFPSPAYPSLFSHVGAKSNSNISDHKLLLAGSLSCNEGLDCVRECLKGITTPPPSPPSKPLLKVQLILQLKL